MLAIGVSSGDRVASDDKRSLEGQLLADRYQLVRLMGSGGMGEVYRAKQISTGGRVAIKVMDASNRDAASLNRFRYEAETTARLSHPNTVRILDFGADKGFLFLVMEYLQGADLTRFLRSDGQSNAFVAHLLYQVACSLAEAHARGLVHRDIKPNNIMIIHHPGLPSFIKVIDFGIARAVGGPGHGTVGILGTIGYIAPETTQRGVRPDARSDLYSLGCVAYELLAGRLPFDGILHRSPPMEILEAHVAGRPTPLEEVRPDADPELVQLIMDLIKREPSDRPASAGELIEPLGKIRARLAEEVGMPADFPEPLDRDAVTQSPHSLVGKDEDGTLVMQVDDAYFSTQFDGFQQGRDPRTVAEDSMDEAGHAPDRTEIKNRATDGSANRFGRVLMTSMVIGTVAIVVWYIGVLSLIP